jgi:hypothetical protein
LLSLYDLGDQQQTQLKKTIEIAGQRLAAMQSQRDDLDAAIDELGEQIVVAQDMLSEKIRQSAA